MKPPIKVFSDWAISGKDEGMKDNHLKPVMKMIELFENKYENPSFPTKSFLFSLDFWKNSFLGVEQFFLVKNGYKGIYIYI